MAAFSTSVQNPIGLNPGSLEKVRVTARGGALAKGDFCVFDVAGSDAAVNAAPTPPFFGVADYPMANVLQATAAQSDPLTCVALEAIGDDAQGWVAIRGTVQVLTTGTIAAGDALGSVLAGTAGELDQAAACIHRAVALEDNAADSTLTWVVFDGISGFGFTET